ncbi:hypothetical protein WMO13_00435 [Ignatzschineria larvae DSM 13226]|uniref:Uncharacterized protein n=1 Tax=Ignatzschineria larvae DSM 13226 TaxID=1111732 RepID=A0ABZ3C3X3_9GAMM|nr:hypothetical protein [Ignatzschineria larvae]
MFHKKIDRIAGEKYPVLLPISRRQMWHFSMQRVWWKLNHANNSGIFNAENSCRFFSII